MIVLEEAYNDFVRRLVEATRSLVVGPPEDPARACRRSSQRAAKRIEGYIEQGKREARSRPVEPRRAAGPTAATSSTRTSSSTSTPGRIAQEEIFGPVVAVMQGRGPRRGARLANGSKYALTGGLISRSPAAIERVRRDFRVGNLYINRGITGALVERQPFGGFKMSGIGSKAGGPDYLLQFLEPRVITENTMRRGFAPPEVRGGRRVTDAAVRHLLRRRLQQGRT